MNGILLVMTFALVITVGSVTATDSAGYKSMMTRKTCTDSECENVTVNCLYNQPCVTSKWNSTDSVPQITRSPNSPQIIENDAPPSVLNSDEFR
jgi:hypothetical protein